jgi:hypothetical protein
MRPYFVNAATEGSAHRHPDRPSKLDSLDILTDELAILGRWQAFQPFPERFSTRFGAEENRRDSLTVRPLRWRQRGFGCWCRFPLCCHVSSVPHTVQKTHRDLHAPHPGVGLLTNTRWNFRCESAVDESDRSKSC